MKYLFDSQECRPVTIHGTRFESRSKESWNEAFPSDWNQLCKTRSSDPPIPPSHQWVVATIHCPFLSPLFLCLTPLHSSIIFFPSAFFRWTKLLFSSRFSVLSLWLHCCLWSNLKRAVCSHTPPVLLFCISKWLALSKKPNAAVSFSSCSSLMTGDRRQSYASRFSGESIALTTSLSHTQSLSFTNTQKHRQKQNLSDAISSSWSPLLHLWSDDHFS